jgi:two-component system sensor histidine kinase BaeS
MAVLRALGPLLVVVVVALTVGGAATAALLVFRPAHRRLRALEDAARRLESGDAEARAPADGGDEIAAVAVAFNAMADELTSRMREIETVDKARRQLIADVSHELMTPLTSLRGYVETLRMTNLNLDPASRERYLGIVHEEAFRLERIVGDLLDVARLSAGGGTLQVEDVVVEELFGRVCDRHGPAAREKAIALRAEIAPDAAAVRGDAHRVEQALQNLAANALRHTPERGHVTLRARREAGFVVLAVEDDGEGIPAEHQTHIFDRFYKVDAARGPAGGSGLGLSIVKAIVERHGGRVSVASAPGRGSVFEMHLPAGDTLEP